MHTLQSYEYVNLTDIITTAPRQPAGNTGKAAPHLMDFDGPRFRQRDGNSERSYYLISKMSGAPVIAFDRRL
jgi:hypothetical protein